MDYGENQARHGNFWWPVRICNAAGRTVEDEIRGDTQEDALRAAKWNWPDEACSIEITGGRIMKGELT